eukprot:2888715-Pyramimonas_sp.AAC.1
MLGQFGGYLGLLVGSYSGSRSRGHIGAFIPGDVANHLAQLAEPPSGLLQGSLHEVQGRWDAIG